MKSERTKEECELKWFAIRTRQDFRAEAALHELCEEVFFPKERVKAEGRKARVRAVIPHVLFIRTSRERAIELEAKSRRHEDMDFTLWIYRYPTDNAIQEISEASIALLKMLTAEDTTKCEIYNRTNFRKDELVRITGGIYKGYEGYVQRVRKNLHVVVRIEGICMVMLPFIHPDLLEKVEGD